MRPKQHLKYSALWLYQLATARRRNRMSRELREAGNYPVAILFYHRVADSHPNDWSMSTRNFALQLDWLQTNFDIVTLDEAQRRIIAPYNDRPTIAITFDDGYAENVRTAIPELLRRNLPATYFVSTDYMRTGEPFPHDAARGVPLQPNTVEDLRNFVAAGIELGAHTKSHANLGAIDDVDQLRDEIVGSLRQLEQWCQVPIRYFSFPYGLPANTSQKAVDIIREAGFAGFCTAYNAWNWPGSEGFHLRRCHADPGLQSIKNRLTLDPRKLRDQNQLPFVESLPQLAT
ncbi:MAG: polysaccharide deacetylase family protein [Pirellulaceae bacterium]|nr:polysaccharide deacetylase family protein [Pirellulaceae bacterium]